MQGKLNRIIDYKFLKSILIGEWLKKKKKKQLIKYIYGYDLVEF